MTEENIFLFVPNLIGESIELSFNKRGSSARDRVWYTFYRGCLTDNSYFVKNVYMYIKVTNVLFKCA